MGKEDKYDLQLAGTHFHEDQDSRESSINQKDSDCHEVEVLYSSDFKAFPLNLLSVFCKTFLNNLLYKLHSQRTVQMTAIRNVSGFLYCKQQSTTGVSTNFTIADLMMVRFLLLNNAETCKAFAITKWIDCYLGKAAKSGDLSIQILALNQLKQLLPHLRQENYCASMSNRLFDHLSHFLTVGNALSNSSSLFSEGIASAACLDDASLDYKLPITHDRNSAVAEVFTELIRLLHQKEPWNDVINNRLLDLSSTASMAVIAGVDEKKLRIGKICLLHRNKENPPRTCVVTSIKWNGKASIQDIVNGNLITCSICELSPVMKVNFKPELLRRHKTSLWAAIFEGSTQAIASYNEVDEEGEPMLMGGSFSLFALQKLFLHLKTLKRILTCDAGSFSGLLNNSGLIEALITISMRPSTTKALFSRDDLESAALAAINYFWSTSSDESYHQMQQTPASSFDFSFLPPSAQADLKRPPLSAIPRGSRASTSSMSRSLLYWPKETGKERDDYRFIREQLVDMGFTKKIVNAALKRFGREAAIESIVGWLIEHQEDFISDDEDEETGNLELSSRSSFYHDFSEDESSEATVSGGIMGAFGGHLPQTTRFTVSTLLSQLNNETTANSAGNSILGHDAFNFESSLESLVEEWHFCVRKLTVSSSESSSYRLLDRNPTTYWQSSDSHGKV